MPGIMSYFYAILLVATTATSALADTKTYSDPSPYIFLLMLLVWYCNSSGKKGYMGGWLFFISCFVPAISLFSILSALASFRNLNHIIVSDLYSMSLYIIAIARTIIPGIYAIASFANYLILVRARKTKGNLGGFMQSAVNIISKIAFKKDFDNLLDLYKRTIIFDIATNVCAALLIDYIFFKKHASFSIAIAILSAIFYLIWYPYLSKSKRVRYYYVDYEEDINIERLKGIP